MKSIGIRNEYSAENIIDCNTTLILGMIWSLILRFNVASISEGDRTAKEGLLLWVQKKMDEVTPGLGAHVTNFHTCFQDGVVFNMLVDAYRPGLVNLKVLDPNLKEDNLSQAFDLAEKYLGIPKMLNAADMVSTRPDEKSVMTYVSFFWKEFAVRKSKQLAGERITRVVQREEVFERMQTEYESGVKVPIDTFA